MATDPKGNISQSASTQSTVRTFATDVARMTGKPLAKDVQNVPAPVPKPPSAGWVPPPAPVVPKTDVEKSRDEVLSRLRAQATTQPTVQKPPILVRPPAPPTESAPVPPMPPGSNEILVHTAPVSSTTPEQKSVATIHTYKSDFADRIDKKDASTFSVLAAQSDATPTPVVQLQEKQKFPTVIVVGLFLICIGIGSLYGAYHYVIGQPEVPFIPSVPSLIFADDRTELMGTGAELMHKLKEAAERPLPEGTVLLTYISTTSPTENGTLFREPAPGGSLIAALSLQAPDILLRNVESVSTVGVIHAGAETRPFFILRVASFERTFSGLLVWEKTMPLDLELLYPAYPVVEPVGTTTPTGTTIEALPQPTLVFVDAVVANHDVRILRDGAGKSILLYGYHDKQTVIIARDEAAFTELLQRLTTTRGQ